LIIKLIESNEWQAYVRASNHRVQEFYESWANGTHGEESVYRMMGIPPSQHLRPHVKDAVKA